jgi:hypothetical protein
VLADQVHPAGGADDDDVGTLHGGRRFEGDERIEEVGWFE